MNLKEKIALNTLKRQLDRGAISKAKAREEYKKITGQDPEGPEYDDENQVIDDENSIIAGQKKEETESQPDDLTALQLLEASLEVLDVVDQKPLPEGNYADPNQERIDTERMAAKGKKK